FITKEQRHGFVRLCEDKPIIFDLNNQLHTSSTTPTESYELITYIEDPIDTSILSDLDNRSTNDAPSLVDRITESETPYVFLRASILLGRFDVTDLLQERGYTLNIVDQAELSLVHIAVLQNRNMEALNYLISNGAPLSYLDASGLTPLDYAIRLGYPDQAKLLESAGAKTREHRLSEKWFGLGLKLRANRGMIEVQSFSTQSPAQNSGQINIGDVLLEVNGVELTNKSLCFASQRIRGADQSLIELRIQSPDGSIRECTLTRGEFHDHPLPLEQAKD
ncbi:MAG: PDZ domain-containing protein, partial [Coraliomargarita sp.]